MAVNRSISHLFCIASLLILLGACSRLEPGFSEFDQELSRELVCVPVNLAIAPAENGTPATKADYDPDVAGYNAADAIKTITVLQFEKSAVGDDYTRIGTQVCYDWASVKAGTEKVALLSSTRENVFIIIANATAPGVGTIPLAGNITLKDFVESQNGSVLSVLDALDGTGIWYSPDGTEVNRYLRMSAVRKVDKVTLETTLGTVDSPLYLKRNCAKVVIRVQNTSPEQDKVTIEAVQLRNVNGLYHYVTNIPSGMPVSFVDPYSQTYPRRFNVAEIAFPTENNANKSVQTYTFYVPANMRGKNSTIGSQKDKSQYAPQGATHFCVYATYGSPAKSITYTYYLGADLKNDFNLEPNKKYEYTIVINGKGNPATDSRIEDRSEVVFSQDANSYMLNPPVRTGASTTFSIPVRRAAVFWNQPGTNSGVYSAADREAYRLLETSRWEAFFVWNEIVDADNQPVPDNELLVGASGTGFTSGSNRFIKIKVKSGMKGNALVAVRKTSAPTRDDILWSWHLWVTDYNPYISMTPEESTYIYDVPGGELHRYADKNGQTIWTSGEYANGFIMDRNLGATRAVNSEDFETFSYGLYYQFGRKDPFRTDVNPDFISGGSTKEPPEGQSIKYNIRYSIHHPEQFIGGANWTGYETEGSILGTNTSLWNDAKSDSHGADNCEADKSIYDPCPYGWQIPKNAVWSDFNKTLTTVWQTDPFAHGRWYYPKGDINNGRIWYPTTGGRSAGSGALEGRCHGRGSSTSLWSVSLKTNNVNYPYRLLIFVENGDYCVDPSNSDDYWGANYFRRGDGLPVRCIRTSYTTPY